MSPVARLACIVALVVAASPACSAPIDPGAQETSSTPPTGSPAPTRRSTELDPIPRGMTTGVASGLQRLAGLAGNERALREILEGLEVVRAIRIEDRAFALAFLTVPDKWLPEGRNIPILGSLARRPGGWRLSAWQSNGTATSRRNEYSAGTHLCGSIALAIPDRAAAIAAMCDPVVTRLQTVASDGTVYDSDEPVDGIGLLLTEDGNGALRAFYGDDVIYAIALADSFVRASGSEELPDDRAVKAGGSLVRALLAGDPVDVLRLHVHRSIALSMSAMAAVVQEGDWVLDAAPPSRAPGALRFTVTGDGRVGAITVWFLRDNDRWFITAVDLRIGG